MSQRILEDQEGLGEPYERSGLTQEIEEIMRESGMDFEVPAVEEYSQGSTQPYSHGPEALERMHVDTRGSQPVAGAGVGGRGPTGPPSTPASGVLERLLGSGPPSEVFAGRKSFPGAAESA